MSFCAGTNASTAVMLIEVDPHLMVDGEWRSKFTDDVFTRVQKRLALCVRDTDIVARCGDNVLGVLLKPIPRADLDIVLSIVERLQSCVSEPIALEGQTLHFNSAIGLCLEERSPAPTGAAIVAAADCALRAAHRANDGGVRSFTKQMQKTSRLSISWRHKSMRPSPRVLSGHGFSRNCQPTQAFSAGLRYWHAGITRNWASCRQSNFYQPLQQAMHFRSLAK